MSQEWSSNTDSQISRSQPHGRTCPTCHLNVDAEVDRCPRDGTILADLDLAEKLFDGRYQIISVIASGGMGTIYRAVQKALGKPVAIKMLKNQDNSHSMWARFRQEAKTASLLNHPNIIQVYDFGATREGQPFMVMDYVEGIDLGALIKEEGRLKPAEAIRIFSQVCDAMAHAHTMGVLHRDLKPSNLMLTNLTGVPEVKIVDFGIAKFLKGNEAQALTQTGEIFGSPYYMSPEQTIGKHVDHRSDIYSVGCIMYETLSGSVPLAGTTAFETLMKHTSEKPVPIQDRCDTLSGELQRAVMKALEKDPDKRFQTMEELKIALDSVPEAQAHTKLKSRKSIKKAIIIATICGTIIALIIAATILLTPPTHDKVVDTEAIEEAQTTARRAQLDVDFSTALADKVAPAKPQGAPEMQLQQTVVNLTDANLADFVNQHKDYTNIKLADCSITDAGAKILDGLNLIGFSCKQGGKLTPKGLETIIKDHPYLEILELNHVSASDDVAKEIGKLKNLKVLALNDADNITDKGLLYLSNTLDELSLEGNLNLDPPSIAKIGRLTNLKTLSLANSLVSNDALAQLTGLKNLTDLNLNFCPITNEGVKSILKFRKLQRLKLRNAYLNKQGFLKLADLPNLGVLDVTGIKTINDNDNEAFLALKYCELKPYVTKSKGFENGTIMPPPDFGDDKPKKKK